MKRLLAATFTFAIFAAACGGGSPSNSASPIDSNASHAPVTITVWDYYGKATPFQDSVIQRFETQYPWITVDHQDLGYDSLQQKFTVAVASQAAPDLATIDMTWLPTMASNGLFTNLGDLGGGQLNGAPIESAYTPGALDAMKFDDQYITMMFDFDVYSLYYRSDLFAQKNITVPKTWDEMKAAASQLAEDTNGDGKCDKACFEVYGNDTFHFSQPLFQAGGSLLNADNTAPAFNSPEGLSALEYYKSFLDDGSGIFWSTASGDPMTGIKDGSIGMFQDGPYYMGLLKSGAPELKGDWAVATAPYSKQPGSYLGGTGLSIPVNAAHPQEAWLFEQFMLQPAQQVGVFTYAGAAPATTAALNSPVLTKPDPYFGGQAPFSTFLDAMSTATHFPYVGTWTKCDTDIGNMVETVMLDEASPQQALTEGAANVTKDLASG
jgi:multiple sugar transport system substrate-binding protein